MRPGSQDRLERGRKRAFRAALVSCLAAAVGMAVFTGAVLAQSPPPPPPVASLNQLMRGLFFPHSNVVFATQTKNPAEIQRLSEPSTSTDPLTGVFGNWEAVENSALILTEASDLLMTPGRKCTNGRDVPVSNPDWVKLVNQLRDAGMVAYKAAQSKNQDNMIQASEVLNNACAGCHNKYRARNRCQ